MTDFSIGGPSPQGNRKLQMSDCFCTKEDLALEKLVCIFFYQLRFSGYWPRLLNLFKIFICNVNSSLA